MRNINTFNSNSAIASSLLLVLFLIEIFQSCFYGALFPYTYVIPTIPPGPERRDLQHLVNFITALRYLPVTNLIFISCATRIGMWELGDILPKKLLLFGLHISSISFQFISAFKLAIAYSFLFSVQANGSYTAVMMRLADIAIFIEMCLMTLYMHYLGKSLGRLEEQIGIVSRQRQNQREKMDF